MGSLLIKLFIKNPDKTDDPDVREQYGKFAGVVGIVSNLLLCLMKVALGLLSRSIAIIADGINNLADASSSIITLVGFKLLSGVPHEELISVGRSLMEKNDCDFVLANDVKEIGPDYHKGYLIHRDGPYDTMGNNEEIADMISRRVMERSLG